MEMKDAQIGESLRYFRVRKGGGFMNGMWYFATVLSLGKKKITISYLEKGSLQVRSVFPDALEREKK